jgi:hypothetical protein
MAQRRRFLLGAILLLGSGARLAVYLSRPSLTIDETTLSLDLGSRSFAQLLHPLASLQTGPPLFLWSIKACITVAGMSEYALRFIPLLAGLLVPYLVWRVGRSMLPESTALLATALASVAPALIQYSVTVKPYITDTLLALLTIESALAVLRRPEARGAWLRLGCTGVAAVLGSIPAPFFLAGILAALLVGIRPITGRAISWGVTCLALWIAAFVPLYVALYRPVAVSAYMQEFWGPSFFAPGRPSGWWNLSRSACMSLIGRPAHAATVLPFAVILVAGLWILLRRAPRAVAAMVGVPLLLLLVASSLHRYPLAERVLLFAVPTFVWSLAAASTGAVLQRGHLGRVIGGLAVVGLGAVNIVHPYRPPATRQAVDSLLRLAAPGEAIYVASGGIPAWSFYTTDWAAPDTAYLDWIERTAGRPEAAAFHNTAPRGRPVGPNEGEELRTRRRGRVELLGLASGVQWREGRGFAIPVVADSGWAGREAARIRAAAAPTIWVLIANPYPTTARDLLAAVPSNGGVIDNQLGVGGVRVVRLRFRNDQQQPPN